MPFDHKILLKCIKYYNFNCLSLLQLHVYSTVTNSLGSYIIPDLSRVPVIMTGISSLKEGDYPKKREIRRQKVIWAERGIDRDLTCRSVRNLNPHGHIKELKYFDVH